MDSSELVCLALGLNVCLAAVDSQYISSLDVDGDSDGGGDGCGGFNNRGEKWQMELSCDNFPLHASSVLFFIG